MPVVQLHRMEPWLLHDGAWTVPAAPHSKPLALAGHLSWALAVHPLPPALHLPSWALLSNRALPLWSILLAEIPGARSWHCHGDSNVLGNILYIMLQLPPSLPSPLHGARFCSGFALGEL